VLLGEPVDLVRLERDVVLVGGDRLVLGSVVLEHAVDILRAADQPQVANEERHPEHALEHEDGHPSARPVLEPGEQGGRPQDEDPDEQRERDDQGDRDLARAELFLLLDGLVRRDQERARADRERLPQHDDPP